MAAAELAKREPTEGDYAKQQHGRQPWVGAMLLLLIFLVGLELLRRRSSG